MVKARNAISRIMFQGFQVKLQLETQSVDSLHQSFQNPRVRGKHWIITLKSSRVTQVPRKHVKFAFDHLLNWHHETMTGCTQGNISKAKVSCTWRQSVWFGLVVLAVLLTIPSSPWVLSKRKRVTEWFESVWGGLRFNYSVLFCVLVT